jgi:hypothetical protein
MQRSIVCAVVALAATASYGSVPPAYRDYLPPEETAGAVTYLSGGLTRAEADSVKRAAQEYPLEIVFDEKDGGMDRALADMPVKITDTKGRVVFESVSRGPIFLARLPKGRYVVTTKWDDWSFSRRVTIGDDRERVVFEWARGATPAA